MRFMEMATNFGIESVTIVDFAGEDDASGPDRSSGGRKTELDYFN